MEGKALRPVYEFLPTGAVKPLGWLKRQLEIQANGLSGHIDEFWPELGRDSGWLGGTGESWEIGPYYLDGLIPLAYLLDNGKLIEKAQQWMDWILDHQGHDGWFGPHKDPHEGWHGSYDVWPVTVLLKALTQYGEASHDERIIDGMSRFFSFLDRYVDRNRLRNWGRFRWSDLMISILWQYAHTGEPSLLRLAEKIHQQGYDWTNHFTRFPFREKVKKGTEGYDFRTHGVNNAMGIKAPGIWYQLSRDARDREAVYHAISNLDQYHGQATGVFTSDGHLAGLEPAQGTELCTVVEILFSLENLVSVLGDPALADRLERIAYNALPAAFSTDMWSRQYDQQANQILCTVARRDWTTNWDDSNIFGLEPSFSCCTANMHQGWPKFARSLWMSAPDGGLAAMAYAPSKITARVRGGSTVTVVEDTNYPFDDRIQFSIQADLPVDCPLILRIPAWCREATVSFSDGSCQKFTGGKFVTIEREFQPGETLTLQVPMETRASRRANRGIVLERGPLVFSLKIKEEWKPIRCIHPFGAKKWPSSAGERPEMKCGERLIQDFEVFPVEPWNYGLSLDCENPDASVAVITGELDDIPFTSNKAPIQIKVKGKQVPEWALVNNSAGPVPASPVSSTSPIEELTLVPYGCTHLRITELPLIAEEE